MAEFDYIVIGSGLNSLVCAALLARRGAAVCVLERSQQLGGCIRSDSTSLPGFTFDLMSTSHVQFITSPAYAELKDELHAAGLEYCFNRHPVAALLPDGRGLILTTDHGENLKRIAALSQRDASAYDAMVESFGEDAGVVFGLLGGEPRSWATLKMLLREARRRGPINLLALLAKLLHSNRRMLERDFESDQVRALLAPGCLHTGLGPDDTLSALMGQLVTLSLAQAADPMVKGGSDRLVAAFETLIEKHGGTLLTGQDIAGILIERGAATGVQTTANTRYQARRAVIANVTPTQLYGRLLPPACIPASVAAQSRQFRYGRACMTVHIALDEKPQWPLAEMNEVALMHLTAGLDSVTRAVGEADRGLLPAEPTICVVQPLAVDPSRAPSGKWILWLQLLELPKVIKGDAGGEISVPADGRWHPAVAEAFADRLVQQLSQVVPNLEDKLLYRKVISPADLEAANINLVGGDPYSGHCGVDQQLLFRPLPALKNHATPVKNLYQIGASTHPGPGLGGMSGYLVAKALS